MNDFLEIKHCGAEEGFDEGDLEKGLGITPTKN
jgi:hypothetical protein